MNKTLKTALIMKEDMEQQLLEWSDTSGWFRVHVSTKHAPHRYNGDLAIEDGWLVFRGRDIKEGKHCEQVIPPDSILEVRFGFDEFLESSRDLFFSTGRSLPLVVHYEIDGVKQTAYLNTFRSHYPIHILNGNREWYELLKDLTSYTLCRGSYRLPHPRHLMESKREVSDYAFSAEFSQQASR